MQPTRREMLKFGLGSSALLATGATVPTFLAHSASALADQPNQQRNSNILVVVQLDGGNDGLNTVVPYTDDVYRRSRPRLNLPTDQLHRLNDDVALHANLGQLKELYDDNKLAVVQSVGYPNPNRSHFSSTAIWETARLNPDRATSGWLARGLDNRFNRPAGDSPALHIGDTQLPQALHGSQRHVPSFSSLEQFRRRLGISENAGANEQRAALDAISRQEAGADGSLLQFVERTSVVTYSSSARLEQAASRSDSSAQYPESYPLARRLKLIAQLIKADMQTSIYYTEISGFDTHANQLNSHSGLMRQVGNSLKAFVTDINRTEHGSRVLVLVFSEFGRRLRENASAGTDHGTAAPVFLLGRGVRNGVHGPNPDLQNLNDGDPRFAIDFRRVYSTLLDQWLGCRSREILGGQFEHLPILRA